MFTVLIIVHVIVSLILIALVLLQPGEGKGLSETFGGGVAESILGSKANSFLIKATGVMAAVFFVICVTLTIMTAGRSRSLLENESIVTEESQKIQAAEPEPSQDEPTQK
ncbi:MAG: preprotein translocase subunit SecG [Candidatus Omnitrophica bacterium]|nr:preprotein translocase subunit SecG [Candidatus Omnitrophota bacterium]